MHFLEKKVRVPPPRHFLAVCKPTGERHGKQIKKGERVKVLEIKGVKIKVEREKK